MSAIGKEVNEVIFGIGGIADSALPNLSIVDTSTIDRTKLFTFTTNWQAGALPMQIVRFPGYLSERQMAR